MIGIYKITNPKGKIYIGQSIDINKRFAFYKRQKCKGQIKLYNSFIKYGFKSHTFEVIVECEINQLNKLERYYQDLFNVIGKNGLNLKLTKTTDKKVEFSIETKNKISYSHKKLHAIKKGIYFEGMQFKSKDPKELIYFSKTNEYFKSLKQLYDKYDYMFISYNVLCYNKRKGNPLITPKETLRYNLNYFSEDKKSRIINYLNQL